MYDYTHLLYGIIILLGSHIFYIGPTYSENGMIPGNENSIFWNQRYMPYIPFYANLYV